MTDNHVSDKLSTDVAKVMADLNAQQVFLTNAERSNARAPWLEFYNTGRRHSAIGGLPPISRLS
jgi:transposase InsO family protein